MENMPAGWLPDPRNERVERYWDGQTWTGQTRVAASAKPTAQSPRAAARQSTPKGKTKKRSALRKFIPVFVGTAVVLVGVSLGLAYLDGRGDEQPETSGAAMPGPACASAFAAAAAVPVDQVNDTEFDRTATDCVSVDEWTAGADLYPDALGQTRSMSKSELELAVQSVCFENEGTPMCEDAAAQEILQ